MKNDFKLINDDCINAFESIEANSVDVILTSPPYNISATKGKAYALKYRGYIDCMPNDDYIKWLINIFLKFDNILSKNGVILLNMSYGTNNNETMWLFLAELIKGTPFTIADHIVWKKKNAFPNNCSPNKLTRITENVFVICRKKEFRTFNMNKNVVSIRKNGQKMYQNIFNFVEAENNDKNVERGGHCATFSTELCIKLLNIYNGQRVMDCFMGIGTTGVACKLLNRDFIGIEIEKKYFEIAQKRIDSIKEVKND